MEFFLESDGVIETHIFLLKFVDKRKGNDVFISNNVEILIHQGEKYE